MTLTSSARAIALSGLAATALAGCGSSIHSQPGSTVPVASAKPLGYGVVDRARRPYFTCIRAAGLPVVDVGSSTLQVGPQPAGPTIHFEATPGGAQEQQIDGQAQGAEAIGAAQLYVHGAPDAELEKIENCLDQGVTG